MGQKPSTVLVKNQLDRRVRVRVDGSRSYTKCLSITESGKLKAPAGSISASISYSSTYDVFYIVDTSTSFTIVGTAAHGNEIAFDLNEDGNNFGFLTVWTENNDGSWSIFCENHPIIKCGEVQIGVNILTKQFRFGEKDDIGRPMLREDSAGRIVVYNRSSRNIWARVDADGIEKTKETVAHSVEATNGTISLSETNTASAERKVYYRAKQGKGYTLVRNNGKSRDYTVFHMKISNNLFYLSIDYETSDGSLISHCVNHSMRFKESGKKSMDLVGTGEMMIPHYIDHTPHIFVTDSGNGIKFQLDHQQAFLDDGF